MKATRVVRSFFFGLAAMLGQAYSAPAPAATATFAACEACTAFQARMVAAMLGRGDHHIYSISTAELRRFEVSSEPPPHPLGAPEARPTDREMYQWMSGVVELAPLPAVREIFDDMVALDRADPGFFTRTHDYELPIANIGNGHDPARIGLDRPSGGTSGQAYNRFVSDLGRTMAWFPDRLGQPYNARRAFLDRLTSVGVTSKFGGLGLGWRADSSAPIRIRFRDDDGSYVLVEFDMNTEPPSATVVGAFSASDVEFPPRNNPGVQSLGFAFGDEISRDRFVNPMERAGVLVIRTSPGALYVSCAYIDGQLSECTVTTGPN
jgi:hypothetical protein